MKGCLAVVVGLVIVSVTLGPVVAGALLVIVATALILKAGI